MNKTLEWIRRAEQPTGGLAAWQLGDGSYHSSYQEVTGYLLPTLIKFGAHDLVIRCADWLLRVQNPNGSYNGLDGIPRPFDTSAVIEGLEAVYKATGTAIYRDAANRATAWMMTQTHNGHLKNNPGNNEANIYQLRAASIIGYRDELRYWEFRPLITGKERSHYLAYALEGLLNFGAVDVAMPYIEMAYHSGNLLQPFYVDADWQPVYSDVDYCASAQMAILFHRVGLDTSAHYEAVKRCVKDDGGLAQGNADNRSILWAAKYLLDLQYLMDGEK